MILLCIAKAYQCSKAKVDGIADLKYLINLRIVRVPFEVAASWIRFRILQQTLERQRMTWLYERVVRRLSRSHFLYYVTANIMLVGRFHVSVEMLTDMRT